ncbi:MAG TPA: hypothetical protein VF331_05035 [Polyangiales bacterium]
MLTTRRGPIACLALLLAGILLWAAPAVRAATVLALDLAALVRQSDEIVIARAEGERSHYRPDRLIVTDVKLRVLDALKGKAHVGDVLVATRLGGSVDGIGLAVPGEASFPSDRSAIVFLRHVDATGELQAVGMSQGVLPIEGDGATATVMPGGAGAALVQRADDGKLVSAPDALLHPQTLRSVLGQIQKLVAPTHAR